MTLDAQTKAFLERAAQNPPPPPGSVPLEAFRDAVKNMKALDHAFEEVGDVRNVAVERHGADDLVLRVYRPAGGGTRPTFVWAHGGSWVRSNIDASDHFFRILANRSDSVIVGVEYRLAPEAQLPAQLDDVYDAALWSAENLEAIGGRAGTLAIGGESSGANLAAAVTLLARERGDLDLRYQVLMMPVLDATFSSRSWQELGTGYVLTRDQLEWAVEQYAPNHDRRDPLLSPLFAESHSDLPPALIVTGEYDPLRDDGEGYAAALESSGVAVRHVRYDGLIHHALLAPQAIGLGGKVLVETAEAMRAALATPL